ncbi:hypothetical protein ENBRE01_0098 [Enteropsectra breve]|nr:hypothetical protein ENBRE01_0098 [Enteropsectra breve]
MQIILQKFTSAETQNCAVGRGAVAFMKNKENEVMGTAMMERIRDKIARIKMYESWTESLAEKSHALILKPQLNLQIEDANSIIRIFSEKIKDIHIVAPGDNFKFVNDGPCTFILDF